MRREESPDQSPKELQDFKVGGGEGADRATRDGRRKPESKRGNEQWEPRRGSQALALGAPGREKWVVALGRAGHWQA